VSRPIITYVVVTPGADGGTAEFHTTSCPKSYCADAPTSFRVEDAIASLDKWREANGYQAILLAFHSCCRTEQAQLSRCFGLIEAFPRIRVDRLAREYRFFTTVPVCSICLDPDPPVACYLEGASPPMPALCNVCWQTVYEAVEHAVPVPMHRTKRKPVAQGGLPSLGKRKP